MHAVDHHAEYHRRVCTLTWCPVDGCLTAVPRAVLYRLTSHLQTDHHLGPKHHYETPGWMQQRGADNPAHRGPTNGYLREEQGEARRVAPAAAAPARPITRPAWRDGWPVVAGVSGRPVAAAARASLKREAPSAARRRHKRQASGVAAPTASRRRMLPETSRRRVMRIRASGERMPPGRPARSRPFPAAEGRAPSSALEVTPAPTSHARHAPMGVEAPLEVPASSEVPALMLATMRALEPPGAPSANSTEQYNEFLGMLFQPPADLPAWDYPSLSDPDGGPAFDRLERLGVRQLRQALSWCSAQRRRTESLDRRVKELLAAKTNIVRPSGLGTTK
ncbi:PREDICTED: uncharacterized protein LOC106808272 isoform X1 [Priapulus caudatus]|uniref:Uncharacterized protein LOC106808272 isoform X1 n=1 Tax=Priapulus caudatus TaxID=37621 RepID=A0ABM1E2H3_PRICU|nr:PREDICTED: uncharacterized protein LOC106808272 isoform X1 [Priapulus caudatus]